MNENMVLFLNVLISFFTVIGIVCFFGCIFNTIYELRNRRKSAAFLIADLDELSIKHAVKEAEYLFYSMYDDRFFGNERRYNTVYLICSDHEKASAIKNKIKGITGSENDSPNDLVILDDEHIDEAKRMIYGNVHF